MQLLYLIGWAILKVVKNNRWDIESVRLGSQSSEPFPNGLDRISKLFTAAVPHISPIAPLQ